MISKKVITPIVVEKIPKPLDLVQPSNEIITVIEIMPIKNAMPPKTFGNIKSLLSTFKGNPSVVIIKRLVIAKMDTKNAPVANMENRNIFIMNLLESCLSNKMTNTVKENPHNRALINWV